MLDCEFTVAEGPHARRKFWQMFTVPGGKVDENGVSIGWKISKSTFRAMIDSALGLDPQDMSEAAKAKRILRGFADLSGITFVAKIKVEPSNDPATATATGSTGWCCPTSRSGGRSWTARRCRRARAARGSRATTAAAAAPGVGTPQAGARATGQRRAWAQPAAGSRAEPPKPAPRRPARSRLAERLTRPAHGTTQGKASRDHALDASGSAQPPHAPFCGGQRAEDPGPDADLCAARACALCGREARGFGYVHKLLSDRYPHLRFCSQALPRCRAGASPRNNGMIDKTDMETRAIKDARRFLAEVLTELGLMAPFHDRSAAEIDRIIEACVDGFQEGMRCQAPSAIRSTDDIPF